jgi:predicted N-acetyltransferase YhbS
MVVGDSGIAIRNPFGRATSLRWTEIEGFRLGRYKLLRAVCLVDLVDGSVRRASAVSSGDTAVRDHEGGRSEVSVREVRVSGRERLLLATELLQRARRADPHAGIWEAADMQWWWRRPRTSDEISQLFWVDDQGPVAGVVLTSWNDDWQCDPISVPGSSSPEPELVWARALQEAAAHAEGKVEVPVADDDAALIAFLEGSGLVIGQRDATAWMDPRDRASLHPVPDGFALVDRSERSGTLHPMRDRNGDAVEERLRQCPLYDPELDLAVETADGQSAGYSLYWFDPVTAVGLVEPVRVEDGYQRRGLARAMLTAGLDRLAAKGAKRLKISYESDAAGAVYKGVGFRPTSTSTWYERRAEELRR